MAENDFLKQGVLGIVEKRISSFTEGYRQNIALIGNDPEEISSLLETHLQSQPSQDLIFIHTTCAYTDAKSFFKSIVFSILRGYMAKNDSLDALINHASFTLNNTTAFIKELLKKNTFSFLDVLETINKFINESQKKCVLIIEEFPALEDVFARCFKDFSKFIILQRDCMVILASSAPRQAQKILAAELNLLFGNFEKIHLNERSFLDNYLYLKNKLFTLRPSPLLLSFFVNILGSNRLYYDAVAEKIKEVYDQNDEEATILAVLENSLYLNQTYLFQKFMKRIDILKEKHKDSQNLIKILISISRGYLRKDELNSLNVCNCATLNAALTKLIDLNYIVNYGNIYKITDALFSFWLSHVFKIHFYPPFLDKKRRRQWWRKAIFEEIALFKEYFLKDKIKRVLELVSSFKDDVLKIGKDKYRLPTIERTNLISYPEQRLSYLVGEGREIIFVGIKEKRVDDNDVYEFIERGSNIKGKKIKKIFITLDRFSPSAKLVAKNHKLIIWDVNEINHLLNVYNKPLISFESEKNHRVL
ncbi:MAG: hypothetical protein JSW17_02090 [Candidatus Omnitrophota bacterium]|nr:MAG: hypothetical protein JSW17_02090 [Candidatus Omnitrophota bacterium]